MNVVRFLPHKMWAKTIGSASLLLSSLLRHSLSLVEHSITELNTIEYLHIHKHAQNSSYHYGCRNFWSDIQKYIRFKIRFGNFQSFFYQNQMSLIWQALLNSQICHCRVACHTYEQRRKLSMAVSIHLLLHKGANSEMSY